MHKFHRNETRSALGRLQLIPERRGGVAWINVQCEQQRVRKLGISLCFSTAQVGAARESLAEQNQQTPRPFSPYLLFGEDVWQLFLQIWVCALVFGWRQQSVLSTTTVCFARYLASADSSAAADAQSVSTHAPWSYTYDACAWILRQLSKSLMVLGRINNTMSC